VGHRRVSKKCAEVEGPGEEVEYEFYIEGVPYLTSSMRPFERRPAYVPRDVGRHQHRRDHLGIDPR